MPNLAKMHLSKADFRICFFQYIAFKIFQTELIFNYCNSCNIQQPSYLKRILGTKYVQNFWNIRSKVIAFQADKPFYAILHSFAISKQDSMISTYGVTCTHKNLIFIPEVQPSIELHYSPHLHEFDFFFLNIKIKTVH